MLIYRRLKLPTTKLGVELRVKAISIRYIFFAIVYLKIIEFDMTYFSRNSILYSRIHEKRFSS